MGSKDNSGESMNVSDLETTQANLDQNASEMITNDPETSEYETTTDVFRDEIEISATQFETEATTINNILSDPEVTTISGEAMVDNSTVENNSPQSVDDNLNGDDNENKNDNEDKNANEDKNSDEDNLSSEKTTGVANPSDDEVESDEAPEINAPAQGATEMPQSEDTTINLDDASTGKAPRFDIENEDQQGAGTTPETSETTETEEFTTLNSIQGEAGVKPTTVTVVSIKETNEEVMFVTTVKPTAVTDDDRESNDEEDIDMTSENSDNEQVTEVNTTTESSEYGDHDHEFLCKESIVSDEESDIPLECVLTNGDEKRTVVIVIPRDSLGGERDKLFNKNVKIIVKDFMVMERSPRA